MAAEQAMTPEALDQWRWEQAEACADARLSRHHRNWWPLANDTFRGLVREDVRPEKSDSMDATATNMEGSAASPGADGRQAPNMVFKFDRYVNGVLMAEGVKIERQATLETAMIAASSIAAKGPNGEAPVLVYRAPKPETAEPVAELRDASEIPAAIEIWFFRDLGETQRRQLINWCGFPGVEANGEAFQRALLHQIIAALSTHPAQPEVVEALERAYETFLFYASEHWNKAAEIVEHSEEKASREKKAQRNQDMADKMQSALTSLKGSRP